MHVNTTTIVVNFLHNGTSIRENLRHGSLSVDILLCVLLPCKAGQVVVQMREPQISLLCGLKGPKEKPIFADKMIIEHLYGKRNKNNWLTLCFMRSGANARHGGLLSKMGLYIYCNINCTVVKCKYCGMESHSIHSNYIRTISDLPIQDYQVRLVVTVPKFFCTNERCRYKTFAYPLPFAASNSLRTKRLDDYIYQVGMKNSSLDAQKQISGSHVSVSNNTILRIIKKKQTRSSITTQKT